MLTTSIDKVINSLLAKEIVSIPTDTIYGLSCVIELEAVNKLIKLKQRDINKKFVIISHDFQHFFEYIKENKLSKQQLTKISSVPNVPTTWIVPAKNNIQWLTRENPTIAIRLVNTDIIKNICSKLNNAIISTSANVSGEKTINNPVLINEVFAQIIILETQVKDFQPSRIIDVVSGEQIR